MRVLPHQAVEIKEIINPDTGVTESQIIAIYAIIINHQRMHNKIASSLLFRRISPYDHVDDTTRRQDDIAAFGTPNQAVDVDVVRVFQGCYRPATAQRIGSFITLVRDIHCMRAVSYQSVYL